MLILHNLCVRTPYQNDRMTNDGESESDSELGHAEEDGLNVFINNYDKNCSR
jgi:hypothetical protein